MHAAPAVPTRPDMTSSQAATQTGYSLIETAVVLAILALVAGTMLSVATTKIERRQATNIAERFDRLEEALLQADECDRDRCGRRFCLCQERRWHRLVLGI
jgi:prepilin-type N-terminal cleavage/methylation domain-containing protein